MDIHDRDHLFWEIIQGLDNISWPANADEPDYVAQLVKECPSIIGPALSRVCPGKQINVGGAFIHQKPIVHFVNRPGLADPELGDLVIICREKRSFGVVGNAMFLQAKCSSHPLRTNIPYDHQFILYSEWPEFEYKRAGSLNGKRRSILPKTITQGAQYLVFDKSEPSEMFTAAVDRPLKGTGCLAFTLASILTFDEGRTFQFDSPRDDWSQMVLDMLRLSVDSKFRFTRQKSEFHKQLRWSGDRLFSLLSNQEKVIREEMDDYDIQFNENVNTGDNSFSGMSVLCIDLGETHE